MIDKSFYIIMIAILTAIKPEKFDFFDPFYNFTVTILYLSSVAVFLLFHRRYDKSWMRFDVLFIIGYSIVHFQIPFLLSINIEPIRVDKILINRDLINYAVWMSSVAINLWMLGYSFFLKRYSNTVKKPYRLVLNTRLIDSVLLILMLGFIFTAGAVILKGVYNVEAWGGTSAYIYLYLTILIYLRMIYFFQGLASSDNKGYTLVLKSLVSNKIFSIIFFSYFVIFLLSGSRGEVLRLILLAAFLYSIYVKHISFKTILIASIIGSFIFTIIGLGRVTDLSSQTDESIFQRGYNSFSQNKEQGAGLTDELATSIRNQYRALDTFPEKQPYLYGKTYVTSLFGPIPLASGLVADTFNIDPQYLGSASYFTYLKSDNPLSGEGSEILGDIYINYGLSGSFIIMFIFGMFCGRCYTGSRKQDIAFVLLYSVLIISSISINRGSIIDIYKTSIYMLIFHAIFSARLKR